MGIVKIDQSIVLHMVFCSVANSKVVAGNLIKKKKSIFYVMDGNVFFVS